MKTADFLFGKWTDTCCTAGKNEFASSEDLYRSWTFFSSNVKDEDMRKLSKNAMGRFMNKMGYHGHSEWINGKPRRIHRGIGLKAGGITDSAI